MSFVTVVFRRASDWLTDWFQSFSTIDVYASGDDTAVVEFIGGPFDGLLKTVDASNYWYLPVVVEIPVCRQQLESLDNFCPAETFRSPTSIACYVLDASGPRWFYRFEKSQIYRAKINSVSLATGS
jgi:hypothetical protein